MKGNVVSEIGKSCCNAKFFVTKEKVALLKANAGINHCQEIYLSDGLKSYWYNLSAKWLKNDFAGYPAKIAECFEVFLDNLLINIQKLVHS